MKERKRRFRKINVLIFLGMLLGMSVLPGQVAASGEDIEVIVTQEDGMECALVTFEGNVDWEPIGNIPETGINMPGSWMTTSWGPFENEPSPESVALFLNYNSAEILFNDPICAVSIYYASWVPVTFTAYDQDGNVLASIWVNGNSVGGVLEAWDSICVDVGENIKRQ